MVISLFILHEIIDTTVLYSTAVYLESDICADQVVHAAVTARNMRPP